MTTIAFDNPLAMNYFDEETNRHYLCIYDQKSSAFHDELSTIWESMYKIGLRKQTSCHYTHQPLKKESETKGLTRKEDEPANGLDLARIHHDRALDAGKLRKDKGRRWRRKNYRSGVESQSSDSSSQSLSGESLKSL